MISDFNTPSFEEPSGEWVDINKNHPGRYRFYKTRLYGRLHFVKTLSAEMQADLISIEALRKEFTIGYSLDHPSIVRYLRLENDAIYEEFVDGKTLREMLDDGDERLQDTQFIAKVCQQLLEAVEYMHSMGVLHLDIKPENVMITRVGNQVKIIDFGCAYAATDDSTQGFTLQYKAPEQGNGETNGYTDIYLVGKTIEELAADAGCLRKWKNFISRATAAKPSNRFKTEAEAIRAIPKRLTGRTIAFCLMGILAAIIAGISLHKPQYNDNTESLNPPTPTDTIIIDAPRTVDTVYVPVEVPAPPDQRTLLERQISDFISTYYQKTIKPICPPDTLTIETEQRFQSLMQQAFQRSRAFGDSLATAHPEYESIIHGKVYEVINAQQTQASLWFYGQ